MEIRPVVYLALVLNAKIILAPQTAALEVIYLKTIPQILLNASLVLQSSLGVQTAINQMEAHATHATIQRDTTLMEPLAVCAQTNYPVARSVRIHRHVMHIETYQSF